MSSVRSHWLGNSSKLGVKERKGYLGVSVHVNENGSKHVSHDSSCMDVCSPNSINQAALLQNNSLALGDH